MTRKAFGRGMAMFMAVTRKKYSEADQEIFFDLLQGLEEGPFFLAIKSICKRQEEIYPNTNIIALILGRYRQISKPRISGAQAWEMLIKASESWELQRDLDPVILRTKETLGVEWWNLVPGGGFEISPVKLNFVRKDFLNFYEQLSDKAESQSELLSDFSEKVHQIGAE